MGTGPLQGIRIVELAGLGPAPFCGMLLSDLGADLVMIDHKGQERPFGMDITRRGRPSVAVDLKCPEAVELCLKLIEHADALIEGFRPGVMERLGLGPEVALARNPRLAYGRMTGWGQAGPYARNAAHDLNYIAISGALHSIGTRDRPIPPLNLIGDGAGGLYLALGLLSAILHSRSSGQGQVIDCAMCDGAASLMSIFYGLKADARWGGQRESNLVDGGAPFYNTYICADGRWIAVAALEPRYYARLLERLELDTSGLPAQYNTDHWPRLRQIIAERIATRTRAQWCERMMNEDACFAPVLDLDEAPADPHNLARDTFVRIAGTLQPAPAPRFSRTPGQISGPPTPIGESGPATLRAWGVAQVDIEALQRLGALG